MDHKHDPLPRILGELPEYLDHETEFMSGGYDRLSYFQEILEYGENALPELLTTANPMPWWRIEAVTTIAESIGDPIEFPEAAQGHRDQVAAHITAWGILRGHIPFSLEDTVH